jgi:hypothetical protein
MLSLKLLDQPRHSSGRGGCRDAAPDNCGGHGATTHQVQVDRAGLKDCVPGDKMREPDDCNQDGPRITSPVDRAMRILDGVLKECLEEIERTADAVEWPLARKLEQQREVGKPVESLILTAKSTMFMKSLKSPKW